MARWKLTEPHYLDVPGTMWEQTSQDRATGRTIRKQFPVQMHLDPNIESDWNYQERIGNNIVDGSIIVCHVDKGEPKDIPFRGDPTPGMLPLDDEAKALSAKLVKLPITQSLNELDQHAGWQTQLLVTLSDMKDQVAAQPKIEGLAEFMKGLNEIMKAQTEILAKIANPMMRVPAGPVTETVTVEYDPSQHVIDEEAPLEPAEDPTEEELLEAASTAAVKDSASKLKAAQIAESRSTGMRRL